MIISVKIGYAAPIRFRGEVDAWKFLSDVFSAAFIAENPEDMSIDVDFKREEKDELRSDSSSETV